MKGAKPFHACSVFITKPATVAASISYADIDRAETAPGREAGACTVQPIRGWCNKNLPVTATLAELKISHLQAHFFCRKK